MIARKLPALAAWLLKIHGYPDRNPALHGDLLEEFASGRSRGWLWRQTFGLVAQDTGLRFQTIALLFELAAALLFWKLQIPHGTKLSAFVSCCETLAAMLLVGGLFTIAQVLMDDSKPAVARRLATVRRVTPAAATGLWRAWVIVSLLPVVSVGSLVVIYCAYFSADLGIAVFVRPFLPWGQWKSKPVPGTAQIEKPLLLVWWESRRELPKV